MYVVQDYIHEPLYVITPIFNPMRFKSRWKLYQRFAKMVHDAGGILVTVEAAFRERNPALKTGAQAAPLDFQPRQSRAGERMHQYVKTQTTSELWLKESLINHAMGRLPHDWKYAAWVDSDVMFARPNWVGETIHQLQHYKIVQMFSEAYDLRPDYTIHKRLPSFIARWQMGDECPKSYYDGGAGGTLGSAPGFAWAIRRDAWDEIGGLLDVCIVGAADYHMAGGFIGKLEETIKRRAAGMHPRYVEHIREFGFRCDRHIRKNVGMVSGALFHNWHGKKKNRGYADRADILVNHQFNPDTDLKRDWQGLYQFVDRGDARSIALRDDIMRYFRARNEDSIDVE